MQTKVDEIADGIDRLTTWVRETDRTPHRLADGEVIDLGGNRVRPVDTPHVPHGWLPGSKASRAAPSPGQSAR